MNRNVPFERRKFVRVPKFLVVYYTDVTVLESRTDAGQSKDISTGGVLFVTDREFPKGTVLRVKLRLPDTADYITVKAEVVESKQRVKDLIYDTRAKFIGVRDQDKNILNKSLDAYLKN